MTDFNGLRNTIRSVKPDAIIHLAGVSGAACDQDPDRSHQVNVTAMQVLCDAAAIAGTSRIVFSSTAAIYGDQRPHAVSEGDAIHLTSSYARSKSQAEKILREAADTNAFSSVALRIFNVYGENFASSLVQRLQASTPRNPVLLQGLDTFVRDYVHVDDVAEAILLALGLPSKGHMTVNIGSGVPTTNRQLVRLLSAKGPIHYQVGETAQSYSCADIRLATDILDYTPTKSFQDFRPASCVP